MITLSMLVIFAIIAILAIVLCVLVGGLGGIVITADVVVCIWLLVIVFRALFRI